MLSWPHKDPDEILDYELDWSDRLEVGETITSSTFTVAEGDVVVDSTDVVSAVTIAWLSGGTLGTSCTITNRVITSVGRTYDESVKLRIRAR